MGNITVATNIFSSPENTGPGNFGRRLAVALSPLGVVMLPSRAIPYADVFLGNAFLDEHHNISKPTILRIDGPGIHGDILRVEQAHRQADVVIYQSEYSKKVLQTKHNYTPKTSYVINNGVMLPRLEEKVRSSNELETISICHNWSEVRYRHYFHVVYRNLESIVHVFPNFRWTIIGHFNPFKDAMQETELVKKHIRFIEFTPTLDAIRRAATFCIHLVGGDSCPNSVIESMSYGLPCIVWKDSAGPELIEWSGPRGQCGSRIGNYDERNIINAIGDIDEHYVEYSKNARRITEEKLDINVVAKKYKEVFDATA